MAALSQGAADSLTTATLARLAGTISHYEDYGEQGLAHAAGRDAVDCRHQLFGAHWLGNVAVHAGVQAAPVVPFERVRRQG